jgi:nicotinamidase-related amidase
VTDGKLYALLEETAKEANLMPNLIQIRKTAHDLGIPVIIVPHHQWTENDYNNWEFMSPSQLRVNKSQLVKVGSWGAEFHPDLMPDYSKGDVVATNHWNSSGFANTDLDYQLHRHGIDTVICTGLIANTCLVSRPPP